jgi:peptidoglycan/xylan/chitin deacetylase (PgdA/CDA1 family)
MDLRRSAIDVVGGVLHTAGAFRFLHARAFAESVSILMYHGLVDAPLPVPEWCFLPLERFERQMEYLARYFQVVHLEDAFEAGRRRSSKPLACVTLDDGFASAHDLALPVLERLQIPATVYLVTDLVDSDWSVWFARLHQAVCQSSVSEVRLNGRYFPLARPADRAESSIGVQRALQPLARPDFAEALDDVLSQLGFPEPGCYRPWKAFRILTAEQIRHMSRGGLVRFGAHTASHQILTRTTRQDAQREIESSVAAVAALVERPSRSFAYPHGGPDDFDRDTIEDIKRAGIDYAVSTIDGPNGAATDPYLIRRYGIGADYSLSRFAALAHHTRHGIREFLGRAGRSR